MRLTSSSSFDSVQIVTRPHRAASAVLKSAGVSLTHVTDFSDTGAKAFLISPTNPTALIVMPHGTTMLIHMGQVVLSTIHLVDFDMTLT